MERQLPSHGTDRQPAVRVRVDVWLDLRSQVDVAGELHRRQHTVRQLGLLLNMAVPVLHLRQLNHELSHCAGGPGAQTK